MTQHDGFNPNHKPLALHRLALLASIATLGVAVLVGVPAYGPSAWAAGGQPIEAPASQTQAPVAGFADLVERVKPAVIAVQIRFNDAARTAGATNDDAFGQGFGGFFRPFGFGNTPNRPGNIPNTPPQTAAEGSGFFISADGYAMTNNHVINNAKSVRVITDDGRRLDAKVVGIDPKTDLALIKVAGNDFPFVKFADHTPRIGDWVVAVGNPFGLGGTVTVGVVSATGRDIGAGPYDDFMQIDAPINRGNSGGPTFDVNGNVIGVNTSIYSPSGGSVGIGFDVPAATAKMVVAQLKDNGYVTRGWMGVQVQGVTKDIAEGLGMRKAEGAIVDEPQAGSPAARAGLKAGDVIMAVDGNDMKDGRDLARTIAGMAPGTKVNVDVWRDGTTRTVSLTLGQLPDERQANNADNGEHETNSGTPRLGLSLVPASEVYGAGNRGVAITAVAPNGPAAEHGMQTGDVILEVGGKPVTRPDDVREELAALYKAGKSTVVIRLKSGDSTRFVAVPFGKA
jgi:serine protease Do